jgi:hypothetical protein
MVPLLGISYFHIPSGVFLVRYARYMKNKYNFNFVKCYFVLLSSYIDICIYKQERNPGREGKERDGLTHRLIMKGSEKQIYIWTRGSLLAEFPPNILKTQFRVSFEHGTASIKRNLKLFLFFLLDELRTVNWSSLVRDPRSDSWASGTDGRSSKHVPFLLRKRTLQSESNQLLRILQR